jgi:UDP-N-acetylglucosamine--N-acetylmuramyl-(pentapeptide) pyrophosphoryl-undecaprenol N-acetylglucosamine transferase
MIKFVFTGGGSGGHFYPVIAVAQEVIKICEEQHLITPELYYVATDPYDEKLLYEHDIIFKRAPAGKMRRYASAKNITDPFKTFFGTIRALFLLFSIYPDVVFSKGSYVSVPTVMAARILGIPVIIHDSDAIPGRANLWASKFARRIAISYPQAIDHFDKKVQEKVALVGNPVRAEIIHPETTGAHEFLGFSNDIPTILILGGSQGAQHINDIILDALPDLLHKYQVVHQTCKANEVAVTGTAGVMLEDHPYKHRYKAFGYLDDLAMRMSAGIADLIISRAGSGSIFEIAAWGKPAILIPLREEVSRDQRKNAYSVARMNAALVLEEDNLTPHVLTSEIDRLFSMPESLHEMSTNIKQLYRPDAAHRIAQQLIAIALKHEDA